MHLVANRLKIGDWCMMFVVGYEKKEERRKMKERDEVSVESSKTL